MIYFEGIDLNEEAEWLLVSSYEGINDKVIFDRKTLIELHKDLQITLTEDCGGTTPDYMVTLYKNGKAISSVWYCSWEFSTFDLGRLEPEFMPASYKQLTANSIERHDFLLDSLKQLSNVYLLHPYENKEFNIQYFQWH